MKVFVEYEHVDRVVRVAGVLTGLELYNIDSLFSTYLVRNCTFRCTVIHSDPPPTSKYQPQSVHAYIPAHRTIAVITSNTSVDNPHPLQVMKSLNHSVPVCCICADEVMAVLRLDNQQVAQTSWKPNSQQCWDHRCSIDLDRVRPASLPPSPDPPGPSHLGVHTRVENSPSLSFRSTVTW